MKVTATIASKLLVAAVAGWGFGVLVSQPFKKENVYNEKVQKAQPKLYKLVQMNAEWNKQNTVKGLDKIPNCSYVYQDITNNPNIKCKLPCVTLYRANTVVYKWEGNIMMKSDLTPAKVQEQIFIYENE